MGGPARITIEHTHTLSPIAKAACHSAEALLSALESRYSRYRNNSLVSTINRRAGSGKRTPLDQEAVALMQFCQALWEQSAGRFDPTSGILRRVWNFRDGTLGDPGQLEKLLGKVGWDKVSLENDSAHLEEPEMEIDLGGVVKEYAADKAAQHLRDQGIEHALVELAGDVVTIGTQQGGEPWRVGISDPNEPANAILTVELVNAALATSGTYQRFIDSNGQRYSHFLNPVTGWPVEGPSSVSVISDTCLTAGAVATVACLTPRAECPEWLERAGAPWLQVDFDGRLSGPLKAKNPSGRSERTCT